MAAGDLSIRVPVWTHDEIGQLTNSFNQMAAHLEKREKDLKDLNQTLEQRVEARTQELDRAMREAERANQIKSEFLATMSHELRTPLNSVMGYSQILLQRIAGDLNPLQHSNVERILASSKHLLNLINDILDLSKIESGRFEIFAEPFQLQEWVDGIAKEVKTLTDAKNLQFHIEVGEEMPPQLIGDSFRLRQITVNLLSNAIKFTDEGSIWLRISKGNPADWIIQVEDTGIGIPPHAQEYVFDEFRQADSSSTRKYGGTGLGLAIANRLVKLMGGKIILKSEIGKGSSFTLTLPLRTELAPTTITKIS